MVLSSISENILSTFLDIYDNILFYIVTINIWDIIDLLMVTVVVFMVVNVMRKSNAYSALKGILLLLAIFWISDAVSLHVVSFILSSTLQVGLIAVIILFQPELRNALGRVGSGSIAGIIARPQGSNTEEIITHTVDACRTLSWERTGALIVFERRVQLGDVAGTGSTIDSAVHTELVKNIFYPKAPLHDGAAIIRAGRIASAGCMLPLTTNSGLSKELGMRHRAGIGMSENSDAVVVMVSEESGSISVATNGMLKRHLTPETLDKLLRIELMPEVDEERKKGVAGLWQRVKGKGK